jgi:hypothetical protein
MLGDAAFRDTGSALRREGQSVKLPKQSNLPPDPRSDTRIWRRRASRCTKWRASRVRPRGRERSVLSRALFSFRCYIPSGSSRSHSSPCCCSMACVAAFPPASKLWDISMALPPSATAWIRRCPR